MAGPDEICTVTLKIMGEYGIKTLIKLYNLEYDTGDWLRSTFIIITKKNNSKKCCDYRMISLMSYRR